MVLLDFEFYEILVSVLMWSCIIISAIAVIFGIVSQIKGGNLSYIIFGFFVFSGIFIVLFAAESLGKVISEILSPFGIYVGEDVSNRIAIVLILVWIALFIIFISSLNKKK